MSRKSLEVLFFIASCCVVSATTAAADSTVYESEARKAAEIQAAASVRDWQDPTPLKLNLDVFRVRHFPLAEVHDPALQFFTGYQHAPLPRIEVAIVEVNAYAIFTNPTNPVITKRQLFWRMIVGLQASAGSSPEVFFSTKPFLGECGDPMIRVMPGRLLRIDRRFLFELKQEQLYHGCAGQKETVRNVAHLFSVEERFREVFQYEELFSDGSQTTVAMLRPVEVGEDTGSSLLLQAISYPSVGSKNVTFAYLKWSNDGRLVPQKRKEQ